MLDMILAVAGIQLAVVSSPGPTFFALVAVAGAQPRRIALLFVAGVLFGTLAWSCMAAFGLGAVVAASPALQLAIRAFGGAYLAWFGFGLLRAAWRGSARDIDRAMQPLTPAAAIRTGFLTNVSNPKVIAYYASLFGALIPAAAPAAMYAAAVATAFAISAAWWASVALFFALPSVRRGFLRLRRGIDALVGGLLVYFGLRLAFAR